jgi:hypothetical protein
VNQQSMEKRGMKQRIMQQVSASQACNRKAWGSKARRSQA